jgi:hypothetical protein
MSDAPMGPGWWQASDGKWYPPYQNQNPIPNQKKTVNGSLPWVSFGLGVAAIFLNFICGIFGLPFAIAAIVTGIIALRKNKNIPDPQVPNWVSWIGIGLGVFGLISFVLVIVWFGAMIAAS